MMQFWRENSNFLGDPDGPDPPDGAGAAGVHLGRGPRIRSSSGGQDEAIESPQTSSYELWFGRRAAALLLFNLYI